MNLYLCGDLGQFWKLERTYFWNLANSYITLWNESPNRIPGRNMNKIINDIYHLLFSSQYKYIRALGLHHLGLWRDNMGEETYKWGNNMINNLYRYRFNENLKDIQSDIILVSPPKKYLDLLSQPGNWSNDFCQSRKRKLKMNN